MNDFELILQAYEASGGDPRLLSATRVASLVISGNQVIGSNTVEGVEFVSEQLADGVKAQVRVSPGAKIEQPVHLCFGMIPASGVQRIIADFEIGAGASVEFVAHCTFPNAVQVQHIMEGRTHIGIGARMDYRETHYHGETGGVEVLPTVQVHVERGGRYRSEFNLNRGRAGRIKYDYAVDVDADGIAELDARALGFGDDHIEIHETVRLNGENARGLAKSRIAVRDRARSDVYSLTEGNAPLCRGHVDCVEIVRDQAIANAVPVVSVHDPQAQITHEAAIGTVDKKELETIMSRGLDEDAAVDVILRGMIA